MELLFGIFVYSWIVTISFGVIISISYPIFTNYYDDSDKIGCYIPLYNLFNLCALNGYDQKMGLLFLIPFINVIMIMFMSYKLKDTFSINGGFGIGLLLLPGVFVPVLAYTKINDAAEEEKTVKKSKKEKVKEENKNEEENVEQFLEDNSEEDDSIFKIETKTKSYDSKPYKAKKVKVNEQFINSAPASREKIDRVNKDN